MCWTGRNGTDHSQTQPVEEKQGDRKDKIEAYDFKLGDISELF